MRSISKQPKGSDSISYVNNNTGGGDVCLIGYSKLRLQQVLETQPQSSYIELSDAMRRAAD